VLNRITKKLEPATMAWNNSPLELGERSDHNISWNSGTEINLSKLLNKAKHALARDMP